MTADRDRYVILVWMDGRWQVGESTDDVGQVAWKAAESGLSLFPLLVVDTDGLRVPYSNLDTVTKSG